MKNNNTYNVDITKLPGIFYTSIKTCEMGTLKNQFPQILIEQVIDKRVLISI